MRTTNISARREECNKLIGQHVAILRRDGILQTKDADFIKITGIVTRVTGSHVQLAHWESSHAGYSILVGHMMTLPLTAIFKVLSAPGRQALAFVPVDGPEQNDSLPKCNAEDEGLEMLLRF